MVALGGGLFIMSEVPLYALLLRLCLGSIRPASAIEACPFEKVMGNVMSDPLPSTTLSSSSSRGVDQAPLSASSGEAPPPY